MKSGRSHKMAVDKSLLGLEQNKTDDNASFSSLRIPTAGHLPAAKDEVDYTELAQHLLSGKPSKEEVEKFDSQLSGFVTIVPEPGLCVKMKKKDGGKAFMNMCTSDKVPSLPKDVTEEELVEALQKSDVSFRVPMSIGEPHDEVDHSGNPCVAYEVVINTTVFKKFEASELFYQFLLSLALEGLENKHGISIDRNSTIVLKGKKSFGTLKEQRIRTKPRLITDLGEEENIPTPVKPLKPEVSQPYLTPKCVLWLEKETVVKESVVAEIELPNLTDRKNLDIFLSDDRLVLTSSSLKPQNYKLDVMFPVEIDSTSPEMSAFFDKDRKILSIRVPPKKSGTLKT